MSTSREVPGVARPRPAARGRAGQALGPPPDAPIDDLIALTES